MKKILIVLTLACSFIAIPGCAAFKNVERDDWSPNFATLQKLEATLRSRSNDAPERKAS